MALEYTVGVAVIQQLRTAANVTEKKRHVVTF
jgi:hypothetical protein